MGATVRFTTSCHVDRQARFSIKYIFSGGDFLRIIAIALFLILTLFFNCFSLFLYNLPARIFAFSARIFRQKEPESGVLKPPTPLAPL